MKDQFCNREIAIELEKLGFREPCLAWWWKDAVTSVPTETRGFWSDWNVNPRKVSAPLWQQVIDWLRVKRSYFIYIIHKDSKYGWKIDGENFNEDFSDTIYNTYEEAREQTIHKTIELCKNNS